MAEEGKTTQELKAIIERRRATVVATLCGAIEESTLLRHDQNKLKHLRQNTQICSKSPF